MNNSFVCKFCLFVFAYGVLAFNASYALESNNKYSSQYSENYKKLSKQEKIKQIKQNIALLEKELNDNRWVNRYNNYITYKQVEATLEKLIKKQKRYSRWRGEKYKELSYRLLNTIKVKKNELELLSEYQNSPIGSLIKPAKIKPLDKITSPFGIVSGLSYISELKKNRDAYSEIHYELVDTVEILKNESSQYKEYAKLSLNKTIIEKNEFTKRRVKDFESIVQIISTTDKVYSKRVEQLIADIQSAIAEQIQKATFISLIIGLIIVLSFVIKRLFLIYMNDRDRVLSSNKVVNFLTIILCVFIILVSYISNASYLVTFLGFASAGIAIALKDWFMSIFGWMVIVSSGSIHVGDRIKVQKNGIEVVGDVIDISMFKISIREDVTYTSYTKNRRAGRVFFIPNNYIFTDTIANYTFDSLTTVWDGIDFYLTFECNIDRAKEIVKEIVKEHTRGYTNIANHNIAMLQKNYIVRNASVEPRIFTFVEPYGVCLSVWYQTSSYATLPLRSTLSMEILKALKADKDVVIAYPTQVLKVDRSKIDEAEALLPGTSQGMFDGPQS